MPHVDDGQLHAYLDGELAFLGATEAVETERHLATCPACQARLEEARRVRDQAHAIVRRANPPERPVLPFEQIAARPGLRPGRRAARLALHPGAAAAWAASVLLALSLGWYVRGELRPATEMAMEAAPTEVPSAASPAQPSGAARSPVVPRLPGPESRSAAQARTDQAEPTRAGRRTAAPAPNISVPAVADSASTEVTEQAMDAAADAELAAVPAAAPPTLALPPAPAEPVGAAVARGRVTDTSGRAIPGATVLIPGFNLGTLTGPDGAYLLTVPGGRLIARDSLPLVAQIIGYERESRSVALQPGTTIRQNFELEPSVLELSEIMVTGQDNQRAGVNALLDEEPPSATDLRAFGEEIRWEPVDRSAARRWLGARLLAVEGLAVVGTDTATLDGRPTVRTTQRLDGGELLTLVQARGLESGSARGRERARRATETEAEKATAPAAPAPTVPLGDAVKAAPATVAVRRGSVSVAARAPIPPDSLRGLLQRLR